MGVFSSHMEGFPNIYFVQNDSYSSATEVSIYHCLPLSVAWVLKPRIFT